MWGGICLFGRLGAPCTPWGCAWMVWLVRGVSGDLGRLLSASSVSAVGGEKKAGLRRYALGIMVVVLLEQCLLLVRVFAAEVRCSIGEVLLVSEPSLLNGVRGIEEGEEKLSEL